MNVVSSKLTSKGQVTIPSAIRASLGLQMGDFIEFVLLPGRRVEMRPRTGSAARLRGRLGYSGPRRSAEDFADAISTTVRRRHKRSAGT